MKILVSISPRSLWALLESINEEKLVRILLSQIEGHLHLEWLTSRISVTLAALKWILVSCGEVESKAVRLSAEDLRGLIAAHIPLSVTEDNKEFAEQTLLSFDEPEGIFAQIFFLF
jgi:hypothetical protein